MEQAAFEKVIDAIRRERELQTPRGCRGPDEERERIRREASSYLRRHHNRSK
jgi:hypothetical protein